MESENIQKNFSIALIICKIILTVVVGLLIDLGAMKWLLEILIHWKSFQYYSCFVICIIGFIVLFLYVLLVRVTQIKDIPDSIVSFDVVICVVFVILSLTVALPIELFAFPSPFESRTDLGLAKLLSHFDGMEEHEIHAIDEAIKYDQENMIYYEAKGDIYYDLGLAGNDFSFTDSSGKVVEINPNKCFEYAAIEYEKLIGTNESEDDAEINYKCGLSYEQLGSLWAEKALDSYMKALSVDKCDKYLMAYIRVCVDNNIDIALARTYINEIEDKDTGEYYYYKGCLYLGDGDYYAAGDYFDQIGQYSGSEAPGYEIKVANRLINTAANNLTKAIELYTAAIDESYDKSDCYFQRGLAYYRRGSDGDYERAIYDMDEVIKRDPAKTDAYVQESFIFNDLKEYSKSIEKISKAIDLNSQPRYYRYRADYEYNDGRYGDAISDYRMAIQSGIWGQYYCIYSVGDCYYSLGWYNDALDMYIEAERMTEDRENVSDQIYKQGNCYYMCGDYTEAIEEYKKAADMSVNKEFSLNCHYWIGRSYELQEMYTEALSEYEYVVNQWPSTPVPQRYLDALNVYLN